MKIIVTGSESFVGKELIKACLVKGIEVFGVDIVAPVKPAYTFHKGDIRDPKIFAHFPENADALIHLAALSRDPDCKNRAYECFDMNVMGTLNMMKAASEQKTKQFIFASSEWVYGDFAIGEEKNEEAPIDVTKLTSEYALSKLVSESNIRQQWKNGFCDATILRFAIIYGPRKSGSAVESIFNSVKESSEVTIGSKISGRRFIHVDDIVSGIIKSIGLSGFNIVNLSGDSLITLGDIISTSEKILRKKVNIIESNPSEVSQRNPSNVKARTLIKWRPTLTLEKGLRSIIERQ